MSDMQQSQVTESETRVDRDSARGQRRRSIAIALALTGLVVLFYAATLVRLGGNVFNRAL